MIWRKAFEEIKNSTALKICLIGTLLVRNAGLIITVYFSVWVNSYVDETTFTEMDAKTVVQNAHLMGTLLNLTAFYFVGKFVDRYPGFITIPISYFVRMFGVIAFLFVSSPHSIFLYFSYMLMVLGNMMENITIESLFAKNVHKDIRGTLNSV
jgi:hypothetical protein